MARKKIKREDPFLAMKLAFYTIKYSVMAGMLAGTAVGIVEGLMKPKEFILENLLKPVEGAIKGAANGFLLGVGSIGLITLVMDKNLPYIVLGGYAAEKLGKAKASDEVFDNPENHNNFSEDMINLLGDNSTESELIA